MRQTYTAYSLCIILAKCCLQLSDSDSNSIISNISDGDFDFNSRFDTHRSDLFHNLSRTVQINESFVNPHLKSIPGLGSFTTWCFSCCNGKGFGWQSHWSFHHQFLLFCTTNEFSAHFFQTLDITAGQSDSDAMNSCFLFLHLFLFVSRHFVWFGRLNPQTE